MEFIRMSKIGFGVFIMIISVQWLLVVLSVCWFEFVTSLII